MIALQAATAQGVPVTQALREMRVWGDRQKAMPQALRRMTGSRLRDALRHAARIDRIIKGVATGEPWRELQALGLRIAAPEHPLPVEIGG